MSKDFQLNPIGYFYCNSKRPYEAPRQGVLNESSSGIVKIESKYTSESICDLLGFERIWLIFGFNQNSSWNIKVMPPRGSKTKKSVFATRSPYRPNSLGLSCVALDRIDGLKLFVSGHDLLDCTPIFDLKPYLPYADSFPEAKTGWINANSEIFRIEYSQLARAKMDWLVGHLSINVEGIVKNQLEYDPTNRKLKRVKKLNDSYVFALQTWRFSFKLIDNVVLIDDIFSGYSSSALLSAEDPYNDKKIHLNFVTRIGWLAASPPNDLCR